MSNYSKDLKKIFRQNNWEKIRQKGSHEQWKHKSGTGTTVTIPQYVDRNFANNILKNQAYIDYRFP